MLDQSGQISSMSGGIPLGRGLMPEELADFKAKGREWSRLYKEKRRKDFSLEQIEERKLKNRSHPLLAILGNFGSSCSGLATSLLQRSFLAFQDDSLSVCDL